MVRSVYSIYSSSSLGSPPSWMSSEDLKRPQKTSSLIRKGSGESPASPVAFTQHFVRQFFAWLPVGQCFLLTLWDFRSKYFLAFLAKVFFSWSIDSEKLWQSVIKWCSLIWAGTWPHRYDNNPDISSNRFPAYRSALTSTAASLQELQQLDMFGCVSTPKTHLLPLYDDTTRVAVGVSLQLTSNCTAWRNRCHAMLHTPSCIYVLHRCCCTFYSGSGQFSLLTVQCLGCVEKNTANCLYK